MEWVDSWYFTAGVLWFVGATFSIALIAINGPRDEKPLQIRPMR